MAEELTTGITPAVVLQGITAPQRGVLAALVDKLDPKQPFALPEGTIRGLLALMAMAGLIACYFKYQWAPDAMVATTSTIIGFYFGARPTK